METAHWILRTHLFRPDELICSACGAAADKAYARCPACGREMKKTRNDPSWVDEIEGVSAMLDDR